MHHDATSSALPTPPGTALPAPTGRPRLAMPLGWMVGFAVAATLLVLQAIVSYVSVQGNRQISAEMVASNEVLDRLQMILSALKDGETGQRGYLLTGDEAYLEPFNTAAGAHAAREQRLRELLAGNPRQLERLAMVSQLAQAKFKELQATIDAQRAGRPGEAQEILRSNQGKLAMDRIRSTIASMVLDEQQRLTERQAAWRASSERTLWVVMGGLAVLIGLTLAFAALAVRDHRGRANELWVRTALGGLAQQLQGEMRIEVLCERVLGFLSAALNAPVGVLYQAEPDGSLLRAGTTGTLREAVPERLASGEGLPGQAWRSRRPVLVSQVPEGHLPVVTGLGRSAPREILLSPAVHEGQPQAVIELGFTDRVEDVDRALMERASELLGAAISAARDRSALERALEETQRQSEELQAQQEELRVSNEELEEQSRALRESQAELESQQTELERLNGQLAVHAHSLEEKQRHLLQSQAKLEANAEALEAASRYKSEFLANMSHELRTPLNSSLILSRLLIDNKPGTLNEDQLRYARTIHDANNDLLALINDILDLSKIEAGHAELRAEPVPLAELAQRMQAVFDPLAQQKHLRFQVEIDPAAPPAIETDGQRLSQILKNLLANAMKFTARGSVTLAIRPGAGGGVRFEVRDTGMGIPADKQQVIFEAFRQADGSTSRQFGGTGLGLSISRELVQRMGGRIEVASAVDQGSTFSVELPARLAEPAAQAAAAQTSPAGHGTGSPPLAAPPPGAQPAAPGLAPALAALVQAAGQSGRKVLLAVEDDRAFAQALRSVVEEMDFECVVAEDGAQALALAQELRPVGVLLDVGLPDVSGLSVLERLKRDPATRHIPVHIVSAQERSVPALEMGAVGHVVKPALREQLVEAIERIRERAEHTHRRLLIVEDDATLRDNLELMLSGPDVAIDTVGTLADARLALARTTYDCMVTDLSLPDGTGFDLLERMAADADSAFPPVIVYTGRALSRDEETRLRRYSRSIIVKGARSPERLLDEVTLFLHSVEAKLPGEQQRLLRQARQRDAVLEGRSILLAEDDVRNIFALTAVFEPIGVKLETARNGREALERLQRGPAVDLVLMDVMMPEMDGLTAMRRIREMPGLVDVPIIALTAKAMADDRQQCLDAGANDYLPKPIDIDRLLSLCRVWMPK